MLRLRWPFLVAVPVPAHSRTVLASSVVKVRVDDTIQPISDEYIGRAIEQARQTNADAVLIELRTPGGLVDSTRSIIAKMLASPVPVIVYVAPSGARAASAGFFLLEAADVAAMAPGTNTGAAHPVNLGGEKMDDVMKQKVENDSAAFMRSFRRTARAQRRAGRVGGAGIEVVDRQGSARSAPHRLRGHEPGRPVQADGRASRSSGLTARP